MALRHLEVIVDKWPIGPQNRVHSKGDRVFVDAEAARILVGIDKCKYVDRAVRPQETSLLPEESSPRPRARRGRYGRRDMRAED